jgi:hypothetical protein
MLGSAFDLPPAPPPAQSRDPADLRLRAFCRRSYTANSDYLSRVKFVNLMERLYDFIPAIS